MRSQDKRERSRRLTDDSSGNTKLRRATGQRILKGEARDSKAESWRKKTRGREKMPKKEISGGRRRRQRKTRLRARKGKMARAQGIAIWGSRGWLPIQSNPIQFVSSAPPHRKSFLLLSHLARKVVHFTRTTRCGESTSRASILGLSERQLQGRLERRGYESVKRRASVAPIASLCHHPSREHLRCWLLSICSVPRAPL
jgi:hypothetical protein